MKLLHVDSSITGEQSVSRMLSAEIVARFMEADPAVELTYRDLAREPLAHFMTDVDDPAVNARNEAILAEYIDADVVVMGAPMYNFGVPSTLKAWIDRILIKGRTFRYGPDGRPIGLVTGKRIILALARGGAYSTGSPFETWEHAERHLYVVFGFIGIQNCETVLAEGLAISPQHREAGIAAARQAIAKLSID